MNIHDLALGTFELTFHFSFSEMIFIFIPWEKKARKKEVSNQLQKCVVMIKYIKYLVL